MSTIDVESFKTRLLEERERTRRRSRTCTRRTGGRPRTRQRELSGGSDNHLADIATHTYDRELDSTLEESEEAAPRAHRRRAEADRGRHLRDLRELRPADPTSSGSRRCPG